MKNKLSILAAILVIPAFAQSGDVALMDAHGSSTAAPIPTAEAAPNYELVSFVADPVSGEGVSLQWGTAAEVPNSLFTIQRSQDRMNWRTAFTVDSEGGVNGYTAYEFMDMAPIAGISYYRLVASNGGQELDVSDDFAVSYSPTPALQFRNEREPGRFTVSGAGAISDLQVRNNRGQFIPMDLNYTGDEVLVNAEGLAPGTYFVQAVVDGTPVLRTVIVTASGVIGG